VTVEIDDLWVESYQGEVLGEVLFTLLAERQGDSDRRRALQALALLERTTKELAEPVLERRGVDPGDPETTVAEAAAMADGVTELPWTEFLGYFQPEISKFLDKYRRLVVLADDAYEREVAQAYVAHEEALETFLRRSLGEEDGDPLEAIFALPHVAAASST
jgi:hypothetical protein